MIACSACRRPYKLPELEGEHEESETPRNSNVNVNFTASKEENLDTQEDHKGI